MAVGGLVSRTTGSFTAAVNGRILPDVTVKRIMLQYSTSTEPNSGVVGRIGRVFIRVMEVLVPDSAPIHTHRHTTAPRSINTRRRITTVHERTLFSTTVIYRTIGNRK